MAKKTDRELMEQILEILDSLPCRTPCKDLRTFPKHVSELNPRISPATREQRVSLANWVFNNSYGSNNDCNANCANNCGNCVRNGTNNSCSRSALVALPILGNKTKLLRNSGGLCNLGRFINRLKSYGLHKEDRVTELPSPANGRAGEAGRDAPGSVAVSAAAVRGNVV
jgi:hypothetical protein